MSDPGGVLYIGSGRGPRRAAFESAWQAATGTAPALLSYADLKRDPGRSGELAQAAGYIFFDSPDRDADALAAVLERGRAGAAAKGFAVVGDDGADAMMRGAIGSPAQLAFGLYGFIRDVREVSRVEMSVSLNDLAAAFDKTITMDRLRLARLPAPDCLGNPSHHDDVRTAVSGASTARAFLKVRHGASAAGMMALERRGPHWRAITTAFVNAQGELCATRDLQTLTSEAAIGALIDRLAPLGLHLETWQPKFALGGQNCDLRVVLHRDQTFVFVRRSAGPMTNLHLGGTRETPGALKAAVGQRNWDAMLETARAAASVFPGLASPGVDIAFLSDPRRLAIFEINPFGAFVKDRADGPCAPYEHEAHWLSRRLARVAETPA